MVAVLVVLVVLVKKNAKIPERGGLHLLDGSKVFGNPGNTMGIPGMKLIEPVENNSDETGPNCKGV